jgi:uncharacterized membrane protein
MCEGKYVWVEPSDAKKVVGTECTCENTRIGGCVGGIENFICAVSVDDCPSEQYYSPIQLKKTFGKECNLCYSEDGMGSDEISNLKIDGKGLSVGGIIGIIFGVLAVLVFVVVFIVYAKRRSSGDKSLTPPPIEDVTKDFTAGIEEIDETPNELPEVA